MGWKKINFSIYSSKNGASSAERKKQKRRKENKKRKQTLAFYSLQRSTMLTLLAPPPNRWRAWVGKRELSAARELQHGCRLARFWPLSQSDWTRGGRGRKRREGRQTEAKLVHKEKQKKLKGGAERTHTLHASRTSGGGR